MADRGALDELRGAPRRRHAAKGKGGRSREGGFGPERLEERTNLAAERLADAQAREIRALEQDHAPPAPRERGGGRAAGGTRSDDGDVERHGICALRSCSTYCGGETPAGSVV